MGYKPFTGLPCAYHLHYHFCFQTKFNRPRFSLPTAEEHLVTSLDSICKQSKYRLLGHRLEDNRLYCLVSLKPDDAVSAVARTLKSNLAREFNLRYPDAGRDSSLWSIGYYVGGVGKASKKSAERYISSQGEHHGIRDKVSREIMRWVNPEAANMRAAHVTFDLNLSRGHGDEPQDRNL